MRGGSISNTCVSLGALNWVLSFGVICLYFGSSRHISHRDRSLLSKVVESGNGFSALLLIESFGVLFRQFAAVTHSTSAQRNIYHFEFCIWGITASVILSSGQCRFFAN